MQLHCDLQGGDNRSQWTCCVKMMFGGKKSHETFCFLASNGSSGRCGEPCLCDGCGLRAFALKFIFHCKVEFRGAHWNGCFRFVFVALVCSYIVICKAVITDRSGIAASR